MPVFEISATGESVKSAFSAVPVPCGFSTIENGKEKWRIYVVCFPDSASGGGAVADLGALTSRDLGGGRGLDSLIDTHPLLCDDLALSFTPIDTRTGSATGVLGAPVTPLSADPSIKATATSAEPGEIASLRGLMKGALERSGRYSRLRAHEFSGDPKSSVIGEDREPTDEKNFVDVLGLYRRESKRLIDRAIASVSEIANVADQPVSWASMRSRIQTNLANDRLTNVFSVDVMNTDPDAQKYSWMLQFTPEKEEPPSLSKAAFLEGADGPDDFVFALLQNFEAAVRFSLIFEVTLTFEAQPDVADLRGLITLTCNGKSTSAVTSRRLIKGTRDFVVQPVSRVKERKFTLMTEMRASATLEKAATGEVDSANEYGLASFSVDHSLVRDLLMRRERPREGEKRTLASAESEYGLSPPAGLGVALFGPKKDIIAEPDIDEGPLLNATMSALSRPLTAFGDILFLEDMWDGYRLDVARVDGEGIDDTAEQTYYSIHYQSLDMTYMDDAGQERSESFAAVEDCIYRDQRTKFFKPPGVCQSDVEKAGAPRVHPALFTWGGLSTIQQIPWTCSVPQNPYDPPNWKRGYADSGDGKKTLCPALLYGERYRFRLRNTLQGGIGLSKIEADSLMKAVAKSAESEMVERVSVAHRHTRNRPYSPGVFVFKSQGRGDTDGGSDTSIKIGAGVTSFDVWLYPQPLDREEVRFHGLLHEAWRRG
ncbi:MAG: hypothetical protein WAU86_17640, partial [Oricola sp.]